MSEEGTTEYTTVGSLRLLADQLMATRQMQSVPHPQQAADNMHPGVLQCLVITLDFISTILSCFIDRAVNQESSVWIGQYNYMNAFIYALVLACSRQRYIDIHLG